MQAAVSALARLALTTACKHNGTDCCMHTYTLLWWPPAVCACAGNVLLRSCQPPLRGSSSSGGGSLQAAGCTLSAAAAEHALHAMDEDQGRGYTCKVSDFGEPSLLSSRMLVSQDSLVPKFFKASAGSISFLVSLGITLEVSGVTCAATDCRRVLFEVPGSVCAYGVLVCVAASRASGTAWQTWHAHSDHHHFLSIGHTHWLEKSMKTASATASNPTRLLRRS